MWVRIYAQVILLIFANIFKASCEGTSSLTFVIDDTASMYDDIDQVKRSVVKITDIVYNEKSSLINNMVLVTFNDPDFHLRMVTKNRYSFQRALNAVQVYNYNNRDCAELSMHGLMLALETSLPGSFLYVFTDASSKDYQKGEAVKELCQRKQSQIIFVLTGYCYSIQEPGFKVYYDIATACSGLVFFVNKNDVNQIFKTIEETIKGNKTVVAARTVPAGVYTNIPFTIDEHTEYAIVSASGSGVYLAVKGPPANQEYIMWIHNGKVLLKSDLHLNNCDVMCILPEANAISQLKNWRIQKSRSLWLSDFQVIKLSNATPGQYVATVKGDTATSVYIVGRTDFLFSHGFSELEPKTLGDTTPQPIADASVHLSIAVTDPKQEVKIISAQILQEDGKVIAELPLSNIAKDFYVTKSFVAPSQRFKVAVNGIVKITGKPIRRIAKIPITPQKPPKKLPNNTKPTATIVEGKSITVEYNSTMKLTCKVTAYPEPKIKWINSKGVTMDSMSRILQYPYEYISYLTIPNATKGDKYTCYAVNDINKDFKIIEVTVKDPLVVKSVPVGKTNVDYGTEGTITCDIKSPLLMHIQWFYTDEYTGANGPIKPGDKYSISSDGTQLKIKKMDLDMVGRYTCKASLLKNEDVQKKIHTQVQIGGLIVPKLSGVPVKKVIKRSKVVLRCDLAAGVPTPTITWQYINKSGVSSKILPNGSSESELIIDMVNENHEGQYKCVATNAVGSDVHITTLVIQELPIIGSKDTPTVYEGTEGDASLRIISNATGIPKPVITWKLNGRVITPNSKYFIKDGDLIIRDLKVSDTNSYTCEANNEVGVANATFQVHILQAPKISGATIKKVRLGESADIDCKIVKGEPKPTITWKFMDKDSKIVPLPSSGNKLVFAKVEKNDAGRYKCVAQNKVGSDGHIVSLIVESPPTITSNASKVYEGIEGDLALRIPCDVVGIPKPAITWKLNGVEIIPNEKYVIEDGALLIMKPNVSNSASYKCEAKNYIGSVSATFKANVDKTINSFGTMHHVYLLEGETRKLACGATKSKAQSVKWFIADVDMTAGETMLVENATVSDDGNYTCRVSDVHGHTQTHTYVVDVGYLPQLYDQTPLNHWRGDINDILANCASKAKPEADIEWTINGEVLSDLKSTDLGNYFVWGHYTCNVSNVHGSVQRSFEVKSSDCLLNKNLEDAQNVPLLLTETRTWPTWASTNHYLVIDQEETLTLSCPNHKNAPNAFQKFPKQNELKAVCDTQDMFLVDGNPFKLKDLRCSNSVDVSVVRNKVKCLTESSELIRVGYAVPGFLETYEVCFDHAKNMPLYTRVLMTKTDDSLSPSHKWYKYPNIGDGKSDAGLTCTNASSSCCYGKAQLVNAQDFNIGTAKNSTFIDPLNAIPYWRPCNKRKTTWENIEGMVRSQLNNYDTIIAWSGTHTLQDVHGAVVPRYLWKVLRFDEDESIAIVHVNDPSPTNKDIKCENICTEDKEPWFKSSDEYTYCCTLTEFLKAFDLRGTDVGESFDGSLRKITKVA